MGPASKDKALESAIYIGDQWEITPKLSVNAGIRYSMFNLLGPRTYYTYQDGMLPSSTTVVDSVSVGGGKWLRPIRGRSSDCLPAMLSMMTSP